MDKTKTLIILLLLIGAILPIYMLSKWTQRVIRPRQSLGRLLAWMGLMAVAVFFAHFSPGKNGDAALSTSLIETSYFYRH